MTDLELSRRLLLGAAGFSGTAVTLGSVAVSPSAEAVSDSDPDGRVGPPQTTPAVSGLHVQFGADPSAEMVVSWHTVQPVTRRRVFYGTARGQLEKTVAASTRTYTDAKSCQVVYAHHAHLKGLGSSRSYLYGAVHNGPSRSWGSSAPPRRGGSRSRSPASETKAPRPWADVTSRRWG